MTRTSFGVAPFFAPAIVACVAGPAGAQQDAVNAGTKLMADAAVKAAVEAIKAAEPKTIEDQVALCEVEAPPFKDLKRGEILCADVPATLDYRTCASTTVMPSRHQGRRRR